jgi:predicted permease
MVDILNLALPYFGLIFIGFACGKAKGLPEQGLAWINFFLLYVSLPALLFGIMSKTPFAELNNPPFLIATTLGTASVSSLLWSQAGWSGDCLSAKQRWRSLAGSFGNIGYMGPGLALAVLGAKAAAPTALIFCCDAIFLFTIVPLLIALTDGKPRHWLHTIGLAVQQIVFNPLIMSACAGALAAALHFQRHAVGTLLFCKRGGADSIVCARRDGCVAPVRSRALGSALCHAVKLLIHPLIVCGLMLLMGPFPQPWAATAILMASLPPALNVFVIARQHDSWVEPASVAVLIGTFASVITLTGVMWFIQTGRLVLP